MRFVGAWAAIYASQRTTHPDVEFAYETAITDLDHLQTEPVVSLYGRNLETLPLEVALTRTMISELRDATRPHTPAEREVVYTSLQPVFAQGLQAAEADSDQAIGFLTELCVLALSWRPSYFSRFNMLQAGPVKDSRTAELRRFNTDLYAHLPDRSDAKSTRRTEVQVKTARLHNKKLYAPTVAQVCAHSHFYDPTQSLTAREKTLAMAQLLDREMRGETLDIDELEILTLSSGAIFDEVANKVMDNVEKSGKEWQIRATKRTLFRPLVERTLAIVPVAPTPSQRQN